MKLAEHHIAEQSHQLLDQLGDESIGLLTAVEKHLTIVDAPDIAWQMDSIDTGLLRALAGRRRDFLVVEHSKLKEYQVLISARAYGTALMVTWMLTAFPRMSSEIVRAMRLTSVAKGRHDIGAELDMFALIDLNAFIAITRLAVKKAIAELTDEEDTNEKDRSSDPEWSRS